jgi:hypothetical protein
MTFAESLEELNIILGDSQDTTFTPEEKERAMTKAWRNAYVVRSVWDTTLTYTQGTYRYPFPSGISNIQDIYISATGASSPMPDPIDGGLWEAVNRYVQFNSAADRIIPTGYVLYIKGHYKLGVGDTIDDTTEVNLQEYILALAGVNTLTLLGHKKANLFLKNDTSMSELVTLRRELQADLREARASLQRDYQSA